MSNEEVIDMISKIFGKYLKREQLPDHQYIMLDINDLPDIVNDILTGKINYKGN